MQVQQQDDVITPQQAVTLHGLFLERVRRTPDKVAYRHFIDGAWRDYTWREMRDEVGRWQVGLARLGLQRGDRVAIMLRNCPYWMMFDQAAMSLGLVVVPLYTVDRPDNLAYIVNDADVKVMLFENAEQWRVLNTVRDQLGGVVRFVSIESIPNSEPRLVAMADFLSTAARLQSAPPCRSDELASIVYTSGTTGKPKGVMLSHNNMLSNAYATLGILAVHGDDLFLSFLPLSHTFERTLGYYLPVMAGATVAFARSIPLLSEDLKIIRPTLLISVPRIYERIHAAIRTKLDESSALKRKLFHLAVKVGWARFEHAQGRGPWMVSFLLWPVLQKWVAQKILDRMGGRLRAAISGGAALSPEISHMFVGLGLPVLQGYGLTETSPVISGNHLENNFPDSVGRPTPDLQVRLGEQRELLVKGPNVMMGYWNNPEATRAIIDADGWLNTGDVARISETGHIYLTGRTKEIIVMSNGEKIPPSDMEIAILHDPLFDQVMIFGEAHPYLVALAVVNPDGWQHFAQEIGIRADMPEALSDSRVETRVLKRIARNLRGFPGYAKVNRVLLLREPWTIENGLLTPTLKIKRADVVQRYAAQIKELYEGH
ncbi:MAG TPA: long-chain fatty acid--CoA ligase [Gallionella sp.]|nr:long-chain fatty acid--CoA ligase [Gallionella sp.]